MRSLCSSSQASDGQPKVLEWKNRASFVCDVDTPNLFSSTVLFLSLFCCTLLSYSEPLCSLLSRCCRRTYDSPTLARTNLCSLSLSSLPSCFTLPSIKCSSLSLFLFLSCLWCGGWKWNKVTETSGNWVFIAYDFYFFASLDP